MYPFNKLITKKYNRVLKKYKDNFGELPLYFEETICYIEYVQMFEIENTTVFNLSKHQIEKFDMKLFIQLIAASFSSNLEMEINFNKIDVFVIIEIENNLIRKNIIELIDNEIEKMFKVYINELIVLFNCMIENEEEAIDICFNQLINNVEFNSEINSLVLNLKDLHKLN